MRNALREWANRRGYLVEWGPARALLAHARDEIEQRVLGGEVTAAVGAGAIDPAFASDNLAFDYDCGAPENRVLIVVAMPRPAHIVGFTRHGARVNVVLPPTYQRYRPIFEDVRQDLEKNVLQGCRVATVRAPLKLLAARLGLARYGRNNLAYASGIGSYMQLLGYATDAPLEVPAGWTPAEPALLDECERCGICSALCPTGAIDESRVLLRAERCLTLASETSGPWPSHVPASAHHCLIGCLFCQRQCPANPPLPVADSGVVFDEDQTRALMEGDERAPAWAGIRANLEAMGQPYQEPVIGRNVRALLMGAGIGIGDVPRDIGDVPCDIGDVPRDSPLDGPTIKGSKAGDGMIGAR